MIYCKATLKEVKRIKKILEIFMDSLGMEVNNDKSRTFFFNTTEPIKNHLTRVMGYRFGDLPTKYLGTMMDTSTLKIGNWKHIIEKIMKRLDNWTFCALNLAARIVLLKAPIQAIPIYPLSVMEAPKGICNKLVEIYRKFLWGGPKQQNKWALCSWQSLTKPKEKGGLGLRDPWNLNQVLAAKLRWRWLQGGPDLWKEIRTVKYNMPLSPEEILRDQNTPRGSYIWNLSLQSRNLVDNHIFWEIRGGQIARFWHEDWQQRGKMMNLQGMQEIHRTAGFNVWNLWRERNSRIFKGKSTGPEEIWKRTLKQIKETILAENWADEDWKTTEAEIEILKKLNVEQGMIYHQVSKQNFQLANQSRSVFRKPPEGFIKLNCDGAAKENPGPAGFRGIFRNGEGVTEWIYAEHGGTMTNNEAEFMAVYQGLKIARRNGYRKLEIEGDSTMVINAIRQLIQGKSWEKVVKSWRSASTV
eukprot:PITA_18004